MDKILAPLFIPITKVDTQRHEVWGWGAVEERDSSDEKMDYLSSKPHFIDWSNKAQKRSGGKSLGNVRAMHQNVAAGKIIELRADDGAKGFFIGAKIIDDNEWKKVEAGVYTGFSVGGSYVKRWMDFQDPGVTRYTAKPTEMSIVDAPCIPSATFQVIKADGIEERNFNPGNSGAELPLDEEIPEESQGHLVDEGELPEAKELPSEEPEEDLEKWDEEEHPRDGGKFTSKGGGGKEEAPKSAGMSGVTQADAHTGKGTDYVARDKVAQKGPDGWETGGGVHAKHNGDKTSSVWQEGDKFVSHHLDHGQTVSKETHGSLEEAKAAGEKHLSGGKVKDTDEAPGHLRQVGANAHFGENGNRIAGVGHDGKQWFSRTGTKGGKDSKTITHMSREDAVKHAETHLAGKTPYRTKEQPGGGHKAPRLGEKYLDSEGKEQVTTKEDLEAYKSIGGVALENEKITVLKSKIWDIFGQLDDLQKADIPGSPEGIADIPLKSEIGPDYEVAHMPEPNASMALDENVSTSQEVLANHTVVSKDLSSAMEAWLPKIGLMVKAQLAEFMQGLQKGESSDPAGKMIAVSKRQIKVLRKE